MTLLLGTFACTTCENTGQARVPFDMLDHCAYCWDCEAFSMQLQPGQPLFEVPADSAIIYEYYENHPERILLDHVPVKGRTLPCRS